MNVLYIGYWSAEDTLTASTIVPHLKVLSSFDCVRQVVFCSVERAGPVKEFSLAKIRHIPLYSTTRGNVVLTKISDYFLLYASLKRICKQHAIDLVICRSAMAGAFGHRLGKAFNVPYIVESFEPHADYMVESDVWKWYDIRTLIEKHHEAQQKKSAAYLFPVSRHYREKLILEGIKDERVHVLPCTVDVEKFQFSEKKRMAIRNQLRIPPTSVTGIYVGKFGGIYYGKEAFALFKKAFDFFGETFRLIILTSHNRGELQKQLEEQCIPLTRVIISSVPHDLVNEYLSASDFAFCCIRPAPSRKYCSPIKNGEYWANGLPILIERGVGDDSAIVEAEGGGVILEEDVEKALDTIQQMLSGGRERLAATIQKIASRHRSQIQITLTYEKVLLKATG
ncbi:MAG TPA: glycosyltransferase [Chryseosolibacter sp.]